MGCVQRRGRCYRRLLQHDTGGGRIRRVPPDQAKNRCMGELGYVLPGLGEGPRGRQVATRRLRSEGGRRRCLRASALARVARQQGGDTPHGVYFENCPNVQYGFFGNLEVMSRTAASVLTTYLEDCHAVFAPCANEGCDWKFGPWGEDVFMQRCLDHHYVDKVEAW